MATVINSRDVLLQAYSPRVNDVQIQDNLVVDSSQITGDGFTVVGKKSLRVHASSQIVKHYTATGDDLSNITLTVIPSNLTGNAVLSIMSGTVVGSHGFGDGYSLTIPTSDITSDVVEFAVTITESSGTYRDEITVVRSREGSSDVVSYLTQEYCIVPADSMNNPLSYADAAGAFKLWQGTYDVTTSFTFSVHSNPNDLTVNMNTSTGVWSVSAGMQAVSSAQLVLRATQGLSTYDQTVDIVKIGGSYNGVRSRRTFVIPLNNTSVFSDSLAGLVAATDGGPVLGDLVTQYNTDGSFTKSKFWTGSSWVELNAFVDGNLLVKGTVVAEAFSGGKMLVGKYIASDDWNGVITDRGEITTPGTRGWIIVSGDGSSIPSSLEIDAATIRGKITTNQLQVGSVTSLTTFSGNASSGTMTANGTTPYTSLNLPSVNVFGGHTRLCLQVKLNVDNTASSSSIPLDSSVETTVSLVYNNGTPVSSLDTRRSCNTGSTRSVTVTHTVEHVYYSFLAGTLPVRVDVECRVFDSTGALLTGHTPSFVMIASLFVVEYKV